MAKITLDLSNVKKAVPLPEDVWFSGEIQSAKQDESAAKNPIIRVVWKIIEGEFEGRTQPTHFNLVGNPAASISMQQLETLGVEVPESDEEGNYLVGAWEFDTDDLIGLTAQFKVKHGTYQGAVNTNISGYRQLRSGLDEALEA